MRFFNRGCKLQGKKKERWLLLAEKAAVEQDPVKMLELIKEINQLLLEKEERLVGKRNQDANPQR